MNDNRTTNEIKLKRKGVESGRVGHIFNKFESEKQLFFVYVVQNSYFCRLNYKIN